jgi:hypothetical protein
MFWVQRTLDGTLGVPTVDLTSDETVHFSDIRAVFRENSDVPLPKLSTHINPFDLTGTIPRYIHPYNVDPAKVLQVFPNTATGTIAINYRQHPGEFDISEANPVELTIDKHLLVLQAAWDYAEDDGTNPGAAEKLRIMFESRLRQKKAELNDKPFAIVPSFGGVPDRWFTP